MMTRLCDAGVEMGDVFKTTSFFINAAGGLNFGSFNCELEVVDTLSSIKVFKHPVLSTLTI